ncbi:MAG: heavy-metal-associated domain-containing protein [Lachnospiraceae bacterium]|nr:heavy-metal-associated domain-containing protein [Lachnospiraceae bacterium]
MANVIIILLLIVFICVGAGRIWRTIRYGGSCCSSGGSPDKKVRVKDKNKGNYPFSYTLRIEGMVCSGCVRRVENALNSDGELWAKVDLGSKEAKVLSKRAMSRDDFLQLLKGTSYTLVEVK